MAKRQDNSNWEGSIFWDDLSTRPLLACLLLTRFLWSLWESSFTDILRLSSFILQECPTPPNPRVLQHHQQSNIWNEDIYQVPLEDHAKIFHHQPQQRPLFNGDSSYIRTGQRRSRHCSSGKSPMDLPWQLQNKFQQDQEGQEESLLTRNTLGGNYKPIAQSSRPNSQHIYVDLDSSTSSTFSSSNGIGASVEHHHHQRPHCHDSFVVSQC